jgi:hypothetical protein
VREGRSVLWWLIAMVFVGSLCCILWLVGFLSLLPFQRVLPDDRTHLLVRSLLLLGFVTSVAGGILVGDRMWRLRRGWVCRSCRKGLDARVEQTGCCGHCGARAFDP